MRACVVVDATLKITMTTGTGPSGLHRTTQADSDFQVYHRVRTALCEFITQYEEDPFGKLNNKAWRSQDTEAISEGTGVMERLVG